MWGVGGLLVLFVSAYAAENAVFPEFYNGMPSSANRIVSGWESEEGQYPYQLSLRMVNAQGAVSSCGGSIIHESWGMTAAHCTAARVTFVIRTGAVSLTTPESIFETTEYYTHPQYNELFPSLVQPNDISLLKFPAPVEFTTRVQPIRLQRAVDKNQDYSGKQLIASGWGRTWTNGDAPEKMNWVFLAGVSNAYCAQRYGYSSIIAESTICAGYWNVTSQSTCQGDSGGPLVFIEEDGIRTLVGVTSFVSSSGCHTDYPAGFIRPGYYHDWYLEVTGIDFDWKPEESSEESSETSEEDSESEEKAETTEKPESEESNF